jgi:hypothetical protein
MGSGNMSVDSKMTALADEVRALSGTTTTKSIDAMTSDVNAANTEINEQLDLIAQISAALDNKAAGSSGVELPDLTNPASAYDILSGKEAIDSEGNVITGNIESKTSNNLTASGATVTVPAGYYASQATKSVTTATQATPSVSIDANGKISASATQTAGYVSAGTKTGTKQMTTQAAKTITPSTSSQTAVAKNVYTTGAVTVAAIPSNYIIPSGTKTITTNGTHDVKAYASATVNVASTGEDVTAETTAYTTKLASLETAVAALETELASKASGGNGSGVDNIISITISNSAHCPIYYWDNESTLSVSNNTSETINALSGIVLITDYGAVCIASGEYISDNYGNSFFQSFRFLTNDGTLSITQGQAGGG